MTIRITAPDLSFSGTSQYGPHVIAFVEGVAEVDELPAGVRQYLAGTGYVLEDITPEPEGEGVEDQTHDDEPSEGSNTDDVALGDAPEPEPEQAPASRRRK